MVVAELLVQILSYAGTVGGIKSFDHARFYSRSGSLVESNSSRSNASLIEQSSHVGYAAKDKILQERCIVGEREVDQSSIVTYSRNV